MAGAYCRYCDRRCFVYRIVYNPDGTVKFAGHLATCQRGAAHDRASLGDDFSTAHNPFADPGSEHACRCRRCTALKDPDDAEAMHYMPTGADGELCGEAGDWATTDPKRVTCRECINQMIAANLRL